jgi:hypothetical protein
MSRFYHGTGPVHGSGTLGCRVRLAGRWSAPLHRKEYGGASPWLCRPAPVPTSRPIGLPNDSPDGPSVSAQSLRRSHNDQDSPRADTDDHDDQRHPRHDTTKHAMPVPMGAYAGMDPGPGTAVRARPERMRGPRPALPTAMRHDGACPNLGRGVALNDVGVDAPGEGIREAPLAGHRTGRLVFAARHGWRAVVRGRLTLDAWGREGDQACVNGVGERGRSPASGPRSRAMSQTPGERPAGEGATATRLRSRPPARS